MNSQTAVLVTALATAVYGLATLLLWFENIADRRQRDRHYREEADWRVARPSNRGHKL